MSLICSPNFQFTFSLFDKVTYVTGSHRLAHRVQTFLIQILQSIYILFPFLQQQKYIRKAKEGA